MSYESAVRRPTNPSVRTNVFKGLQNFSISNSYSKNPK